MNTRIILLLTLLLSSNALAQTRPPSVTDHSIGMIEVETSNAVVRVGTNKRVIDLFGRRVKTEDLIEIVSARFTPRAEQELRCDDEMLLTATYLLAEVRDPRVLEPLLEISKRSCPNACEHAVSGLRRLGDRRALPRLFEILRQHACDWAAVSAIGKIGDETAIDHLIDTIPAGGAMDTERRFKAIEEITGLSLDGIRAKWGLLYYDKLEQFHTAMHEWWDTNKHLAKIKKADR